MLKIENLKATVDDKVILNDFNMIINDGETHVIMGPNGVGKSTLSRVIMGDSNYKILSGNIIFNGDNLIPLSTDERAKLGIFLAMQYPMEIEGVSNQDFLGIVLSYDPVSSLAFIEQRNYFKEGDEVEFFGPDLDVTLFQISEIYDENMERIDIVRHPKQKVYLKIPFKVNTNDMMRIKIREFLN